MIMMISIRLPAVMATGSSRNLKPSLLRCTFKLLPAPDSELLLATASAYKYHYLLYRAAP